MNVVLLGKSITSLIGLVLQQDCHCLCRCHLVLYRCQNHQQAVQHYYFANDMQAVQHCQRRTGYRRQMTWLQISNTLLASE